MNSAQELEKIEVLVRLGEVPSAQRALKKLSVKSLSIFDKTKAASLARRVSLPQLSVKWLFPFVYPVGRLDRSSPASLLLEYGASLISAGAINEGRRILELLLERGETQAHLQLAFSYVREWDYENAAINLQLFLKEAKADPYTRFVAEVNLLAAFIKLRPLDSETLSLAESLLQKSKDKTYKRLYVNALELNVQLWVCREDYAKAQSLLRELSLEGLSEKSPEYLFFTKWKLIVEHSKNASEKTLKGLIKLAQDFAHGETLRDAHLRWALFHKDLALFDHLYWGTPHLSFRSEARESFRKRWGHEYSQSSTHYFRAKTLGFEALTQLSPTSSAVYLSNGQLQKEHEAQSIPQFKAQSLPFKLLQILSEDYYQSKNRVELSSRLYPQSHFHPLHSIQGVFQLIKRINADFRDLGLEAPVHFFKGRYQLNAEKLIFVAQASPAALLHKEEWDLLKTFKEAPNDFFTRKELEVISQKAPRSLSRYLEKLVKSGELSVVGRGPNTRYYKNPSK